MCADEALFAPSARPRSGAAVAVYLAVDSGWRIDGGPLDDQYTALDHLWCEARGEVDGLEMSSEV